MPDTQHRVTTALADRYRVESEIGRGGMATVYRARDIKHEREVAIKVLNPELSRSGYHPERFLREIRLVAGLTHPHILPLHDSGERDGLLFFVMPLVDGDSLRTRLRARGQLDIDEALWIGRVVAAALDYAHRKDVLHRDIKPENILFQEGQPLVADFGVGRAISDCCDEFTEVGFAVGTPEYMSPEQATAEESIDGRSDQYALACMLYEMLVGHPPFTGSTIQETIAQHVSHEAQPLRSIRPDVPSAIGEAIAKALAKDPVDRFATAAAFGEAIEPPSKSLRLQREPAASQLPRDGTIAVIPFVNSSNESETQYLSDGITDELIYTLAKVKGLQVVSRTSVFALKDQLDDIRHIGSMLGVSTVLEGTVQQAGDRIRITARLTNVADGRTVWSERYDREMSDVFAIQDEISRTIVDTLRRTLFLTIGYSTPARYSRNVKAYNLYLKGRFHWNRRTREDIAEGIRYFKQAIEEDPSYALAYSGLADSYAIQTDYRGIPTAEGMEQAKAEARRALQLDESLAEAHTSLGWVTFIYDWDLAAADTEFRRAIELNPGYATAHQWYAWLLMALDRRDEALSEGRAAMDSDPVSVSVRRTMGWLNHYAGHANAAVQHLERAVEMDPTASENHRVLGIAYERAGMYDDAKASLEEAIVLSTNSAYAVAALGHVHAVSGEKREAERLLAELEARAKTDYVSPVAFVTLHIGLGNTDMALDWLHKAHEERRGWLVYLKVEPLLDPLRDEPRFHSLLERMNLG
ncbi:MAG: protein kinase [Gemmatimonadota bacterium]|nr:MAG: protein kinase [Gemmatimonadota bacterium]